MPYIAISRPPDLPSYLNDVVDQQVDRFLCDVHSMLMLPIDGEPGLKGGCNFSAALTLMEVIGGVSQELYLYPSQKGHGPSYTDPGARFRKALEDHFPWSQEPQTGEEIVGEAAAKCLYYAYRNALTHNLGYVRHPDYVGVLKIAKGPLSDEEIEGIERAPQRPQEWSHPTLRVTRDEDGHEVRKLTIKCFYWGVREMIEDILRVRASLAPHRMASQSQATISLTATATTSGLPPTHVSSGSTD